ncbi:hypothetical protein ACFWWT_43945 [Streptomyces sp. NPDC058676]
MPSATSSKAVLRSAVVEDSSTSAMAIDMLFSLVTAAHWPTRRERAQ